MACILLGEPVNLIEPSYGWVIVPPLERIGVLSELFFFFLTLERLVIIFRTVHYIVVTLVL